MPEDDKLKQALENLERDITLRVKGGFDGLHEIAASSAEVASELEEVDVKFLLPHAKRMLADAVAQQRKEQETWPLVTDFVRLERAFSKLEASGVICRHNFSCCGSCAAVEIWDEMDAERDAGRTVRGCAHYNQQTAEGAIEGQGIWFSYGSVQEGAEAQEAVGREIVAAMTHEGLKVAWSGSVNKRIHVALDWKRRVPAA